MPPARGLTQALGLLEASFRFRRQGCRPLQDSSVKLSAVAASTFSVTASGSAQECVPPETMKAVLVGVSAAYASVDPTQAIAILVVEVTDLSGTTDEMAFSACAAGATYHLLGFPERAPPSGIFPEEA